MRSVALVLLLAVATLLTVGCASPRLVSSATTPTVALADRSAPTDEVLFVPCGAEVAEACARVITPGGEGEEEEKLNKLIVFLGATIEEEGMGFSLGLEYERLITPKFGVGAFAEHTFGDHRESLAGFGVTFHPVERAFLFAGWGVADSRETTTKALIRFGGGYDFPLGRGYFIAPCAYLDFLDDGETVLVTGFNVGKNW